MSNDTKTLDARIRAKAKRDHEIAVHKLLIQPLRALLYSQENYHGSKSSGIESPAGWSTDPVTGKKCLQVSQMVEQVEAAVLRLTTPDAEEKAVAEFLAKVDGLQAQLDELQGAVGAIENQG